MYNEIAITRTDREKSKHGERTEYHEPHIGRRAFEAHSHRKTAISFNEEPVTTGREPGRNEKKVRGIRWRKRHQNEEAT